MRQAKDWYRPDSQTIYDLASCLSCGLVAQQPIPGEAELHAAYSVPYMVFRPGWNTAGWPLWKILREITVARRLWRLKRYGRGRRLLEVGCGAGDFLLAAHRAGWTVQAVEYTDEIAETVRSKLGLDVRTGLLRSGLLPGGAVDVVVFWDVLEHVSDPLSDLAQAAHYLRPGGSVLFSLPTRNAVQQGRRFEEFWAFLDLPRHLYFFNRATLSRLCNRAGLDLVRYRTPLMDALWCHLASSCRRASRRGGILLRLVPFVGWTIVTVLAVPYLAAQSWRRRGPNAFAVAIKRADIHDPTR